MRSSTERASGKEYGVEEDASGTVEDRARGERVVRENRTGRPRPEGIVGLPPGGWRRALFLWGFAPIPFFAAFERDEEKESE